jgi:thymidylate kinase
MTLHVVVVGIDGSGKTTVVNALPSLLAAELRVHAGAVADDYSVATPDEHLLAPGFHPDGLPVTARVSQLCRRVSRRTSNRRRIYPAFKLAQLLLQDDAAHRLAERHALDVFISDGNLVMCAAGRGGNYACPASREPRDIAPVATEDHQRAMYAHILDGDPLCDDSRRALGALASLRRLGTTARAVGLAGITTPDLVLFLDVSPEVALRRITARGTGADAHENRADLQQARDGYLATVAGFAAYRGGASVERIPVDDRRPDEALAEAVRIIGSRVVAQRSREAVPDKPLGTAESGKKLTRMILGPRYVVSHLMRRSIAGAWREPFFVASPTGRRLLREGYSAGVMKSIYDQQPLRDGLAERIFMGYPLHRAVRDRLRILEPLVEGEIRARLDAGREVRIFTAPSGFADDVFWSLERIARDAPDALHRVSVVAADLDPSGDICDALTSWADHLGIDFTFIRGDITSDAVRLTIARSAPFNIALFVGLSAWLPVPALLAHLRLLRRLSADDAVLISDCFTAASYSAGGKLLGYRANYYSPETYRAIVDYCGYSGFDAICQSGADGINHVVAASARSCTREWEAGSLARPSAATGMDLVLRSAALNTSERRVAVDR